MKFNFPIFSAVSLTLVASYMAQYEAAHTDLSEAAVTYLNEKRTKDMKGSLDEIAKGDATMTTALTNAIDLLETGGCAAPTETLTDYGRSFSNMDASKTAASNGIDIFYNQISNYDCKYPPQENTLKGSVADFTNIMDENLEHMSCARNACSPPQFMCYFKPKFSGDENEPFPKSTFDLINTRDNLKCSGEYFTKYAGLLTSLAAFTIGWSYMSS